MTEMMYRVVFKDGSYSAWSFNKEYTEQTARTFNAIVESKEYKPIR